MITNIPTSEEFQESGIAFLNLAWDATLNLVISFDEAVPWMQDVSNDELGDDYWEAAQKPLATALVLVQQGIEFLLKGRITAVSPFLLIAGDHNSWPTNADGNVSFTEFKTIDALNLIKIHDIVATEQLPIQVVEIFNSLRKKRNTIMHTVDKELWTNHQEIIKAILGAFSSLVEPKRWFSKRRDYLFGHPDTIAHSYDYIDDMLVIEALKTKEILKPAQFKEFFGFDKKQRWYVCPSCLRAIQNFDGLPKLAQLRPNTPTSTSIVCMLCDGGITVVRQNCTNSDCKGNVVDNYGQCLTCGEDV